jgi:hypothetical protein
MFHGLRPNYYNAHVEPWHFAFPVLLCLTQALLMFVAGSLLLASDFLTAQVHGSTSFLQDHIPALRRYGRVFAAAGRESDFHPYFSIYVIYIGLQITAFSVLTAAIYWFNRNQKARPLGFKAGIVFILMFCFFAIPGLDLILGLSDIKNPGLYDNGVFYGRNISAVYIYCLIVPMCNAFIYLLIYSRYCD